MKNILISNLYYFWLFISGDFWFRIIRKKQIQKPDPLVSIIIATYNRSEILVERTIPSILSQTYRNIEVIIIGDSCIDDTAERIKMVKDKRIIFRDLKKRGSYPVEIENRWFVQGTKPRNVGMKIARGDWFIFISDDDILHKNHVMTLLEAVKDTNAEFVSASYLTYKNGEKRIITPNLWKAKSKAAMIGGMQTWMYRSYLKCFKWNIHSWRKSWNRPVDYDLQLRFLRSGVKMMSINDVVFTNPPVKGTNTTGYEAALIAEKLEQ